MIVSTKPYWKLSKITGRFEWIACPPLKAEKKMKKWFKRKKVK